MKKYFLLFVIATLAISSCVKDRVSAPSTQNNNVNTSGDTLLYYWSFNLDSISSLVPTFAINASANIDFVDSYTDTVQPGTNINGVGVDSTNTAGGALRVRNPSTSLTISLPTTGYKNIVLKYAVEASSATKAAQTNIVSYTTDGTNYINTAIASQSPTYAVPLAFTLVAFDFSSDSSVNNNPNFKVQIAFTNGNTNTSGNDRYDNITLYGQKQ